MDSMHDISCTMNLIQNMSNDNILQLLGILRVKYELEKDMEFATYTLPTLVMKIKVFTAFHRENNKIINEINTLIENIMPFFENYFDQMHFRKNEQRGFFNFCKTLQSSFC